jgi:hypothetical protein
VKVRTPTPVGLADELILCLHGPAPDSEDLAGLSIGVLMLDPAPPGNPSLAGAMQRTVVADPDFDLFLTGIQREMLLRHAYPAIWLPMAVQRLNNEHIWAVTGGPRRPCAGEFAGMQEESKIRSKLPRPAVNDRTAAEVKEHYQENPFPRWFSTTVLPPMTVAQLLRV